VASGKGAVTVDFGVWPGAQEASVAFTDATISAGSKVEVYVMANGTAGTHTANDHRYLFALAVFTGLASAGVGGTVYGRSRPGCGALIGQYQLQYVWSD
jgi:hypothetical protein